MCVTAAVELSFKTSIYSENAARENPAEWNGHHFAAAAAQYYRQS